MNNVTSELLISNVIIGEKKPIFFIAEVGQNHQGDINIAKKLIDAAKNAGANCVKFQKTDIEEKFTKEVLQRPYKNVNSWGNTYGEHKEYLEFSREQFIELQEYAKRKEIMFSASAMDLKSLDFLLEINVPFIKIGSGDSNNIQLIMKAAKSGKPLIISTGMLTWNSVKEVVAMLKMNCKNGFALLHCISSYPTPLEDVNLKILKLYQGTFPNVVIGYSGHETGIDVSVAATVLGAKIIERHITLDPNQKGTDHKCSLTPKEFENMIKKINEVQISLGVPEKNIMKSERECFQKLGKSIVASKNVEAGHKITEVDIKIKVSSLKGIDGMNYEKVLGKILNCNKNKDEALLENDIN